MGIVIDNRLRSWLDHNHWSPTVPATPTSSGAKGDEAFDNTHFYKAIDTDTWKRVAWDAWSAVINYRITESGDYRLTESGDLRITE